MLKSEQCPFKLSNIMSTPVLPSKCFPGQFDFQAHWTRIVHIGKRFMMTNIARLERRTEYFLLLLTYGLLILPPVTCQSCNSQYGKFIWHWLERTKSLRFLFIFPVKNHLTFKQRKHSLLVCFRRSVRIEQKKRREDWREGAQKIAILDLPCWVSKLFKSIRTFPLNPHPWANLYGCKGTIMHI